MKGLVEEFKEFISRGNVVDLAVAVVIGAAFTAVVTSFANDILMQLVAAVVGKPDFDTLSLTLGDAEIYFGRFLTALINFVIVAAAIFLVVKAVNTMTNLRRRREKEEEAAEAAPTEVELLAEIRDALVSRGTDQP